MSLFLVVFILNTLQTNAINLEEIYNCEPNDQACNAHNCSTLEALKRSGFVCDEFPFFTGGWQMVDYNTYWHKEMETSSKCNTSTSIQSTCIEWITSSTTHSNMNQTCICNSNTTRICDKWECHSTENVKNNIFISPTSLCQCLNYNQNTNENEICTQWNCTELFDNKIYNATYTCISDTFESAHASFCSHWTGDKISLDISEWRISSCKCLTPYCFEWTCNERSMNYYHISEEQFYVGWIVISIAGGLILMCVFAKLQNPRNNNKSMVYKCCKYLCFSVLTMICLFGLLILCFVISGMCGIIVVISIWILSIFLICPLVKWLWKKRVESYWDYDDELSTDFKNKKTYDFWPQGKGRNVYEYEEYNPI